MTRKQSATVGLRVRFREPLRKKLELAAKKKGVSLNAELIERLEKSFRYDDELATLRETAKNMSEAAGSLQETAIAWQRYVRDKTDGDKT
jgi:predicted HicB family RNase H-like nuclease